MIASSLCKA